MGGGTGGGYHLIAFGFFVCSYVFVFCCHAFSVPLFRRLEQDGCYVCFFVFSLFSLSLVPLSRSYWYRKNVVSVV